MEMSEQKKTESEQASKSAMRIFQLFLQKKTKEKKRRQRNLLFFLLSTETNT